MEVEIPYLQDKIIISLPADKILSVIEPDNRAAGKPAGKIIEEALLSPCGAESFESFINEPGRLLIIVNDHTRPTPTRIILEAIAPKLDPSFTSFIIATGNHRGPTIAEYLEIFGDKLYKKYQHKIFNHDARRDPMVYLGTSRAGTEMYINKRGMESDRILIIGSVEPHYFAGYTGGRKGLLPGIAAYSTIEQNHRHALHPEAKALSLEGNPVHEDMTDALKVIQKPIFSIMTVLNKQHDIYAVTSGEINTSFFAAIEKADEIFVSPISHKVDVVVTVARYPMDIDLYQAQKAIDNGKLALNEDGIMILVAGCIDGIGDEVFTELLSSSDSPEKVLETVRSSYRLGYHKAGRMAEVFLKNEVQAVTELSDILLESIFITPKHDLQKAIEGALEKKGPDAKVLFLLDGCITVPLPVK